MREILFRGKYANSGKYTGGEYPNNGEWVYGDLVHYEDDAPSIHADSGTGWHGNYRVAPDTVGQFTERYDRNQVRIFEHDIVVYKNVQFVVYFDFGAWKILHKNGYKINLFTIPPCDIAVISNIHDAPDLVE